MTNIVFILISFITLLALCLGIEFKIQNRENGDIWVGIQGSPGHPHLHDGGFVLHLGETVSIQAPSNWSGRFWARTRCSGTSKHCETGDCDSGIKCNGALGKPPVTMVEIALRGFNGGDFYDVSLNHGFNIMASIKPIARKIKGSNYSCKKSACKVRLGDVCPEKLKVTTPSGAVACHSACTAFNTDQYCCRGTFNSRAKCRPSGWFVNYPEFFKIRCPQANTYAFDDVTGTFTCRAEGYKIVFGGRA